MRLLTVTDKDTLFYHPHWNLILHRRTGASGNGGIGKLEWKAEAESGKRKAEAESGKGRRTYLRMRMECG